MLIVRIFKKFVKTTEIYVKILVIETVQFKYRLENVIMYDSIDEATIFKKLIFFIF